MPMSLEIEDIMVDKVITVEADVKVRDAAKLMNENDIGCLVVVEKGRPIGIVTERDMLKRVLVIYEELEKITVREIMSKPLIIGRPNMEIGSAAEIMFTKKIKKLPIVEGGKLQGLVTLTDLLRLQPQLIKMYKIFSSDLAPKRMKKVFDYYLLIHPESEKTAWLKRESGISRKR
ncbi:MAG: CBS domain-containing protein [Candidatus Bathyarchaeota archaeon]|nr:MAG: CBS domain-containing protein [Candidatus Bathyarchaeota archaeon]